MRVETGLDGISVVSHTDSADEILFEYAVVYTIVYKVAWKSLVHTIVYTTACMGFHESRVLCLLHTGMPLRNYENLEIFLSKLQDLPKRAILNWQFYSLSLTAWTRPGEQLAWRDFMGKD